jgi:hypothetical protein
MEHCSCYNQYKLSVAYYVLIYQGVLNFFLCVYFYSQHALTFIVSFQTYGGILL